MTRRDPALIALAGGATLVYVVAVVALVVCATTTEALAAGLAALQPVGVVAGVALGRLSGPPAPEAAP